MRRKSLFAVLLIALGGELNGQTAKVETSSKPTIVIVHGAWGGGWAFKKVEALLRQKGFDVHRPQLTGQGDRVHLARPDIGLNTHIDDVVNTIL
jgi:dienelactone hydrolase